MTWEKGRQLKSFDTNTYTYNANGIRTSKTIGGVTHNYLLDGAKILRETWGENTLVTLWDNENAICGIKYNGASYYFLKNLQGDIIAITDNNGNVIARYSYDAWGVCTIDDPTSADIATINPFRYHGYYYDVEIGMYYLQSRYYDPAIGRFVNVDEALISIVSSSNRLQNMYSYSINSPVIMIDRKGYSPAYITQQRDSTLVDVYGTIRRMRDIRWGLLGNIADHGCGVIASYNVLLSYSSKTNFGQVLDELTICGGPLALGLLGTNWPTMTFYLRQKFWCVQTASSITWRWGIVAELSECVIVLFKWAGLSGMHFIAGVGTGNRGAGGRFKFFNTGLNIDGKEISIWKLIKAIKHKRGTPVALWGVSGKKGWW